MRVSRGELDAPESSWAISMLIHASQRQFRLSRDEREMMQTFNTFSKDEHEKFRTARKYFLASPHSPTRSAQRVSPDQTNFPGFKMLSGSSACLSRR